MATISGVSNSNIDDVLHKLSNGAFSKAARAEQRSTLHGRAILFGQEFPRFAMAVVVLFLGCVVVPFCLWAYVRQLENHDDDDAIDDLRQTTVFRFYLRLWRRVRPYVPRALLRGHSSRASGPSTRTERVPLQRETELSDCRQRRSTSSC